jgi:hypothetical protein
LRGCSSATTTRIERIGCGAKKTDEALESDILYYLNYFCSKKSFSDLHFPTEGSIT